MRNRDVYIDDDYVVRDGEHVKVSILAMDSVQRQIYYKQNAFDATNHQPHYGRVTDAAAEARRTAAYDAMVRRLQDAWRLRPKDAAEPDAGTELLRRHLRTEPDDNAQARRDAAWARYRDQLGRAWQADPGRATAIERQGEQWRGGR
jgi:hypothetical protein